MSLNPNAKLIDATAVAVHDRMDGWHSFDEVENVIEDFGEDALWEGYLGPMLDELCDALRDHRTDYREKHR